MDKEFEKRIESESQSTATIDVNEMVCKHCAYKNTGPNGIFGRNYFICEKFPDGKPDNITLKGADCEYFEK